MLARSDETVLGFLVTKTRDDIMHFYLDHEKLDVYHFSIRFVVLADEIVESLPRGRAYLADQLRRAGSSISLNIAEGAGEFAPMEKARFYRMAKRSATECSSILDILRHLKLIEEALFAQARELWYELWPC
jgi:four helix bundle protein